MCDSLARLVSSCRRLVCGCALAWTAFTVCAPPCRAHILFAPDGTCAVPFPLSSEQTAQITRDLETVLPKLGVPATVEGIRAGLSDPRPSVLLACVRAAAPLGEDSDVPALEKVASSSRDYETLASAIESIQYIGMRHGTLDIARVTRLRGFARTLCDLKPDDGYRIRAAITMASLGDGSKYKIVLDRLQTNKNQYSAVASSYLFARIVPKGEDGKVINWIGITGRILKDRSRPQWDRFGAADSLCKMGTHEAERILEGALKREKDQAMAAVLKGYTLDIRIDLCEIKQPRVVWSGN